MHSILSLLALLTTATFTSAFPTSVNSTYPLRPNTTHPLSNTTAKRQDDEPSLWYLHEWTSGCDGEPQHIFAGQNSDEFACTTGDPEGYHSICMENMAANGLKVLMYSDGGCNSYVDEVKRDGTCYSAPSDVSE
ncbi:hypothetical protein BU23DRAFT_602874 [Bimuria novae-zelandiae CBS 107.79]|uniref:Uncharacterized protein n=1 Tax=Bimuria novae-zelandiae CBS 107.79 TaxID=1447943 RepID=A0A6A5US32_9PLEO|nr:hypothetical protein BU23DRAFT_602874 [Bimuria novae-zelandiae CBS 107.79]